MPSFISGKKNKNKAVLNLGIISFGLFYLNNQANIPLKNIADPPG